MVRGWKSGSNWQFIEMRTSDVASTSGIRIQRTDMHITITSSEERKIKQKRCFNEDRNGCTPCKLTAANELSSGFGPFVSLLPEATTETLPLCSWTKSLVFQQVSMYSNLPSKDVETTISNSTG